jgi:small neutral amino acid transporter SnatA (MarC family)
MNGRVVVGVVLLALGLVIFVFAPALMISNGTEVILWANILPGIVLVALGIALLATGLRSKKANA